MGSWSIGVCTPIPMVPVEAGAISIGKAAEARAAMEEDPVDLAKCRKLLDEAYRGYHAKETHLGLITPEWQRARTAIVCPPGHNTGEIYADGFEVGVARCAAVQAAREAGMKYLFFIDWDTIHPPDSLVKLAYHLDNNPDVDVVSGVYCMKTIPTFPLIWKNWNEGVLFDWTPGEIVENVVGIPMGCALLRLSLFDRLAQTPENPWFRTVDRTIKVGDGYQQQKMTEDLWFTYRFTTECKGKISVDTSIICDHICHRTGRRYRLADDSLPMKRLREAQRKAEGKTEPEPSKVVLHVGCGRAPLPDSFPKTEWEEIRLDIDEAVQPDLVGSITDIPLLRDGTCDAVFSRHNLEHLHTHEVPKALAEFHRVLKPGGFVQIEVPDLQAVAYKVAASGLDSVLYEAPCGPIKAKDVLFGWGAAVAGGNEFYAHKTGFETGSLTDTLSAAGFMDIVCERIEPFAIRAKATKRG